MNGRPGQQLHSQPSPGYLVAVEGQRNGKFSHDGKFGQNSNLGHSHTKITMMVSLVRIVI